MAKLVAAIVCAIALGFGLIRLGAGVVLMAQAAGVIDIPAFNEPITDIERFMAEKNDQAFFALTPITYLAIIAFMGFCLVFGAIGSWLRHMWGYGFLALYLLTHASLFINFQTINPKINILIAGVLLYFTLILVNRYRQD